MDEETRKRLVSLRRDLHRHPEPAWCEFYTTARIVAEIERLGIPYFVGDDALSAEDRMGVPDETERNRWQEKALEAGANESILETISETGTGAVAVLEQGSGPTVALRVDIDALRVEESKAEKHVPAVAGFRSEYDGMMHACGHDAHVAIGLGVLESIAGSDFRGTLNVFFQPAEEVVGGGKAVAESSHLSDVEYLLALHVGLDHPTGEIVAGVDDFLGVSQFEVTYTGESAHAGGHPEQGHNAVQSMATAVQNLSAISRHTDGPTRVNAGTVEGGTAPNIIPETATIEGEVRGATTELTDYMRDRADRVLRTAGEMHGCSVDIETTGEAPSASSDPALADVVSEAAETISTVERVLKRDELGGSEDASYLMRAVQEQGGLATYVGIGTDHPGGHHTPTFDVDEESIAIGVDLLSETIRSISSRRPIRTGFTPGE